MAADCTTIWSSALFILAASRRARAEVTAEDVSQFVCDRHETLAWLQAIVDRDAKRRNALLMGRGIAYSVLAH